MTPTSHVYFDYYQGDRATEPLAIGGFTPLERVYAFEPVPTQLSAAESRHILGAQGNVWTEYMKTPEHVQYMVLPRMIALAEVVWTPPASRDYDRFLARLRPHLSRLDVLGIRYRDPFRQVASR
jgi:hexosaminidase